MLYEIRTYGEQCLKDKSENVTEITQEIKTLLDDMVETMHEATGVGLAGPQVGVNKRLFVIDFHIFCPPVPDFLLNNIIPQHLLQKPLPFDTQASVKGYIVLFRLK